jgi:hypothetical protein
MALKSISTGPGMQGLDEIARRLCGAGLDGRLR